MPSSAPGVICPRCAIPTASMPGCTAWWYAPASTRRDASATSIRRDITDPSDPPPARDTVSGITDRDQLERGFSRLEPEERAVIVLHHYLDLPLPEVATTLGIPLGTTKSRLYRALDPMRAALDADARPPPGDPRGPPGMTLNDGFDRTVSDWLDEEAEHGCPATSMRSCAGRHGPASGRLVEPRKVAPRAIDSSLRTGSQDGLAPASSSV